MEEWARFSQAANPEGIAFAMTFCLNAWLVYLRRVNGLCRSRQDANKAREVPCARTAFAFVCVVDAIARTTNRLGCRVSHPSDSPI